MPQPPTPNSGGAPNPENAEGGGGGYLPQGKPGGEIIISRAEAAALTAFESDDDSPLTILRARRESGLTPDQLQRLRTRAEKLRSKGYTLKSGTGQAVFKPKNYDQGDDHGLLGRKELDIDAKTAQKDAKTTRRVGSVGKA